MEKLIPREEPDDVVPPRSRAPSSAREAPRSHSEPRLSLGGMLRLALRDAQSGEITVNNGEEVARIHVDDGRLAWIHRSHHPVSVRALVEECHGSIDEQTLRQLLEESRNSRRHFGDVLIDWGIVDKRRLREALKRKIRQDLEEVLAWPSAPVAFVKGRSSLSSELAFEEVELPLSQPGRTETLTGFAAVRPEESFDTAAGESWVDRVRALDHVVGCAILDPKRGIVLAERDMDERLAAVAWSLASGFSSLGEEGEEIIATAKRTTFLVRPAPLSSKLIAVVCFDSTQLSPAMARIVVSKVS